MILPAGQHSELHKFAEEIRGKRGERREERRGNVQCNKRKRKMIKEAFSKEKVKLVTIGANEVN